MPILLLLRSLCPLSPHFLQLRHIHLNPQQVTASGLLLTITLPRSLTSHIIKKAGGILGSRYVSHPNHHKLRSHLQSAFRIRNTAGVASVPTGGVGVGHGEVTVTLGIDPPTKDVVTHLAQTGGDSLIRTKRCPLLPRRHLLSQRRRQQCIPPLTRTALKDTHHR